MKTVMIVIAGIALVFVAFQYSNVNFKKDAPGGIQFHKGTFNEALKRAKEENKLIFLDIYAPWCGPCKKMKSKTFSDSEVGKYFNENFVNAAFDGERGEGLELAGKYGVRGYPTLLFIDAEGKLVSGRSGYHSSRELIDLGTKVQKSIK